MKNVACSCRRRDRTKDKGKSILQPLSFQRALDLSTRNFKLIGGNYFGGDVGSTGVGSQSGMPGFCYPVKQTDMQFKRRQF